jgi:hypothetical protein
MNTLANGMMKVKVDGEYEWRECHMELVGGAIRAVGVPEIYEGETTLWNMKTDEIEIKTLRYIKERLGE